MARRTCERVTLPDEQAEPDETATPARSKAMSAVSAVPGHREQARIGQALLPIAENRNVRGDLAQSDFERVPERGHA